MPRRSRPQGELSPSLISALIQYIVCRCAPPCTVLHTAAVEGCSRRMVTKVCLEPDHSRAAAPMSPLTARSAWPSICSGPIDSPLLSMDSRPAHEMALRLVFAIASTVTLTGCAVPDFPVDSVSLRLVAQDTSWQASYLLPARRGSTELPTGREVHVPVGSDVRLVLTSRDYISDFKVPALGLRDFAAPDLPSELRFRADRPGRYDLRGDELCGLPHTDRTRGTLIVEDTASYRAWVRKRTEGQK